jgi:dUTP pyrophosphatase
MDLTQAYIGYFMKVNQHLTDSNELYVKLENTEDEAFIPCKKHVTDAGFDCRARIDEAIAIEPGKRAKIPLGFGINIPINHTGDLRPRSGLTDEYGLIVGYGTIDAGYTGEVKATIFNLGEETFVVNPKDRIAQLVVLPTATGNKSAHPLMLRLTHKLVELARGKKGHGSTGIK